MRKGSISILVGFIVFVFPKALLGEILFTSPLNIGEVVVTATKTPMPIRDIPLSVSVITRDELMGSNAKTVGELLFDMGGPGIYILSYGSSPRASSSVSIRGSRPTQVLVLLDGVPINSISSGVADLSSVPIAVVERIELVKGPTSHIYGANALGGVINVVTKKPSEKPKLDFSASFGSYGTGIAQVDGGWTVGPLGSSLSCFISRSGGIRDNSDYIGGSGSFGLSWRSKTLSLSLSSFLSGSDFGVPGPVPPEGSKPKYGSDNASSLFDRIKDSSMLFKLSAKWEPTKRTEMELDIYPNLGWMQYKTRYDDWMTMKAVDETDSYRTNIYGALFQLKTSIPFGFLLGGVEGRFEGFSARTEKVEVDSGEKLELSPWEKSQLTGASWVEAKLEPSKFFSSLIGLRLDNNSRYGISISPSASLILRPIRVLSAKASFGRAFKAPTFNDLYWPGSGNPDLKPEYGTAYEAGLELALENVVVRTTAFRRDVRDMIAWVPGEGGLWKPMNVNRLMTNGLELEGGVSYLRWLELVASWTLLDSKQRNEEVIYSDWATGETRTEMVERRAAFIPWGELEMGLRMRIFSGTLLSITGHWRSDVVNYYPNYLNSPNVTMDKKVIPSYFIISFKLVQRFLGGKGNLSLGVDNLLDSEIRTQFGNQIGDRDYPMPRRCFSLSLGLGF